MQPYDYQRIIEDNEQSGTKPSHTPYIIREQVEAQMQRLSRRGIISGWMRGMYI